MSDPTRPWGKDPTGFRVLGTSLEPESMDLGLERTPLERFFVCSAGTAPPVDSSGWSLRIHGAQAGHDAALSRADLAALPMHEIDAAIECAGNGRRLFELVRATTPSGDPHDTQWTLGAMGQARWRGPRLRDVLALAGLRPDARWVGPEGLDVDNAEGEPVRMCLPLDKAQHPDTIVALEMNGRPLTRAHGHPARLVVPGWIGAYWIKWLDAIEVSAEWIESWRADEYYQSRNPDGAKVGPLTTHPLKSSLALAWNEQLPAGLQLLLGYARASGSPIVSVDWSVDDGPWQPAQLDAPCGAWAWTPFRMEWAATPGRHVIRTRARTLDGRIQPDATETNPHGLLWHAVIPHPVRVVG